MKIHNGQWMEIFRSGNYGEKGVYTGGDLDDIVTNFDSTGTVPIVVGHPKDNGPARGWLLEVKRSGEALLGKVGDLHNDFVTDVKENKYRNRSVRIARGENGARLLHLGFLGAVLPEVAGLRQPEQDSDTGFCFCDFPCGKYEDFTHSQDNDVLVDLSYCV